MKKGLMALFLIGAAFVLAGCGFNYSDGSRSGVVQNVSKKGFVCKTWKAELALDGVKIRGNSDSVRGGNVLTLHVPTDELAKKMQALEKEGRRVTVSYDEKLMTWPCEAESSYFLKSVE